MLIDARKDSVRRGAPPEFRDYGGILGVLVMQKYGNRPEKRPIIGKFVGFRKTAAS